MVCVVDVIVCWHHMCVCIYIYIYIYISISCIHMYRFVNSILYIHIYIHIHTHLHFLARKLGENAPTSVGLLFSSNSNCGPKILLHAISLVRSSCRPQALPFQRKWCSRDLEIWIHAHLMCWLFVYIMLISDFDVTLWYYLCWGLLSGKRRFLENVWQD